MYAQAAIKSNTLLRNGAYGIVMRGVQKCTRGCSSLRGRNRLPLCCIKLDTATDQAACTDAILIEGFLFLILWNITYNEMDKARKKVLLFNCFSIAGLGIISFFLHPFN